MAEIPVHEFEPIFTETEDSINKRILDPLAENPDPELRFNVGEGSFLFDWTEPITLEFQRVYERMNMISSVAYILGAFGDYLDQRGIELRVYRHAAQPSQVVITIEGEQDVLIPEGTRFTSISAGDEEEPAIEFATDEAVTIPSSGVISVSATSVETGLQTNVRARTIVQMVDVIDGVIAVYNEQPAQGGDDEESDGEYRFRLIEAIQAAPGAGNVEDYRVWSKEVEGIDDVGVYPLWDGAGTVKVVVFGPERSVPVTEKVREVQNYLDPSVVLLAAFEADELWSGANIVTASKKEGTGSLELSVTSESSEEAHADLSSNLSGIGSGDRFKMWLDVVSGKENLDTVRIGFVDAGANTATYTIPDPDDTGLTAGEQELVWTTGDMVVDPDFNWEAITKVTVEVITTAGGSSTLRFDALRYYDIDGGRGQGQAPVGAQVTVVAPRTKLIDVEVDIFPESGHTVASLAPVIQENLETFFKESKVDLGKVYLSHVANVIHDTHGVLNHTNLSLNSFAADVTLDEEEVPVLGTLILGDLVPAPGPEEPPPEGVVGVSASLLWDVRANVEVEGTLLWDVEEEEESLPIIIAQDWGTDWEENFPHGFADLGPPGEVVTGGELQVTFPDDDDGGSSALGMWINLGSEYAALRIRYTIRFANDFEWPDNGKLPGPSSGSHPTGGVGPVTDGTTARYQMIPQSGGSRAGLTVYGYFINPNSNPGGNFGSNITVPGVQFEPGGTYVIEADYIMNTPEEEDGIIIVRVDGDEKLNRDDIRYRDTGGDFDQIAFQSFFNSPPSNDIQMWLDDFFVWDLS